MKNKTMLQKFIGVWNTKTIVGVAVGAALFGVLMVYGSIRVFTNTSLTTAMIVPVIVGGLFGPLPAAVAAGVGNVIADLIGGWGFWFDWSIGNAVLGMCVGLLPLYGAYIEDGIFEVKHMITYAITVVLGCALAFGLVTPFFTYLWYGGELSITLIQGVVGSISNIVALLVLGIPVLKVIAARNARGQNLSAE